MGSGSSKDGVINKDIGSTKNSVIFVQPGLKACVKTQPSPQRHRRGGRQCAGGVVRRARLVRPLRLQDRSLLHLLSPFLALLPPHPPMLLTSTAVESGRGSALVGVFDGHGLSGHYVSKTARDQLPERLNAAMQHTQHELAHVDGAAARNNLILTSTAVESGRGSALVGVFDGHGLSGHYVSKTARDQLPERLNAAMQHTQHELAHVDGAAARNNLILTSTAVESGRGSALVGVFDGHGLSGHYVSKTARDQLPERLNAAMQHTQHELAHVDGAAARNNLILTSTAVESGRGSALVGVFDGHGLSGHYVSKTARDQLPERLNAAMQHTQHELAHVDGAAARDNLILTSAAVESGRGSALVGVFDGHGLSGHYVSKTARDQLPERLTTAVQHTQHELAHVDGAAARDNLILTSAAVESGRGSALVGVFDGHGLSGHYVSKTARDQLPERLTTAVQHTQHELAHVDGAAARDVWARVFGGVFGDIDEELRKDLFHNRDSGSTAVVALRLGSELIVAHIGDSRCVLARIARAPNGKSDAATMEAVQLTIDHKASNPAEKVRVQEAGGKVLNYMNTIDRIFLPGKSEPGLAVARAFGDFELKSHGLICRPDVTVRSIDANDQFIVMGSDGVWDVLTNAEVVEIVANTWPRSKAAKQVAQKAVAKWAAEKHANSRDDISVAVLFF
ncbi:unnamed protein product [Closterium sp. Naga37s-1]|nr:unnamed protein product [Closterium sp. Naga37s-1]